MLGRSHSAPDRGLGYRHELRLLVRGFPQTLGRHLYLWRSVVTPTGYVAFDRCPAHETGGSSSQVKEKGDPDARLDRRMGLGLDDLHDGLLGRSPRRRRLRRRAPRTAAAD